MNRRHFLNGPLRFTTAITMALFCLLLTGGADKQDLDARHRQIAQMTPSQKAQLYRLWERFEALPPEQRKNLRQLERQISIDKQADELKAVMARYYQWCRTLPAYQRLELQELPIEQRIDKIKNLQRQYQDAAGLKKWFDAMVDEVENRSNEEQRNRLAQSKNVLFLKRMMLFRWMKGMAEQSDKDLDNPLNEQDLAEIRSYLSESTRQAIEKQTPAEQWKAIAKRLESHLRAQSRRSRGHRRYPPRPSGISNEELADSFQSLPLKRQDDLLSLPAEDMLEQIQQIHIDRHFPRHRPKNPGDRPRTFPKGKKRPPTPPSGSKATSP
ncbi:MAG: hypothetical protein JXM70_19580 [Pirellulales bacterium]|nr:hypothetical protein [Pirellulales bacterium]